jgi:hypothetical protein
MLKYLRVILTVTMFGSTAFAVEVKHGILEGTVKRLDEAAKTVVVTLSDGAEHTLHFVKRTAVHGAQGTAVAAKDTFHGLKEGGQVAVHYTAKGSEETAEEIDNIGKDGLKAAEGVVTHVDRGAKTVAIKTADGTEETYRLAESGAKDVGKDIAAGAEKSAKVTVYYTQESGHKVAHFFKKAF